jgi:hypothetical protein
MKSNLPANLSSGVLKDFVKKHTGQLFVTSKVKKILQANKLGGVLKGGQISKKDALKTIATLQAAGLVHKYKTPSVVLEQAIKKYENSAGMISDERAAFEKRKKQRQEKILSKFAPKNAAVDQLMQEREELAMKLKMRQMRKSGQLKEFIAEKLKREREAKIKQEQQLKEPGTAANNKKQTSPYIDF